METQASLIAMTLPEIDATTSIESDAEPCEIPGEALPAVKSGGGKKSGGGGFGFFRAALSMMLKISGNKSRTNSNDPKPVDSTHPREEIVSPSEIEPLPLDPGIAKEAIITAGNKTTQEEEASYHADSTKTLEMPNSPTDSSSSSSSSSSDGRSQFNSALNLVHLYNSSDEEEDPDEVFDAISVDEMIDAKAEVFIAQFYQEIHLQRSTMAGLQVSNHRRGA